MQSHLPSITLHIAQDNIQKYTNLLQSGFEIEITAGETILGVLQDIPGITLEYIDSDVQVIFLNGTAIDDIRTPLTKPETVIALSAWMPGHLSNSLHRRDLPPAKPAAHALDRQRKTGETALTLSLKLFNTIASDRGPGILDQGITIKTQTVSTYFQARPWLLEQIHSVVINHNSSTDIVELTKLLDNTDRCLLTVQQS